MPGFPSGQHRHPRVGPALLAALHLMPLALLTTTQTLALDAPPVPGQAVTTAATEPAPQAQQGFGTDPKHDRPFDQEGESLPLATPTGETPSYPSLELNGLIEGGWVRLDPFDGPPHSEWILNTFELMLTLKPHPWITAQISGDYEDNGRKPPYLDVAHLLIGPPQGAWFIDTGQFYLARPGLGGNDRQERCAPPGAQEALALRQSLPLSPHRPRVGSPHHQNERTPAFRCPNHAQRSRMGRTAGPRAGHLLGEGG